MNRIVAEHLAIEALNGDQIIVLSESNLHSSFAFQEARRALCPLMGSRLRSMLMSESIEFPESGGSIDFLSIEHPRRLEGRRADIVYIEPIWTLMQDRLLREIQVLRARGAEVVRA